MSQNTTKKEVSASEYQKRIEIEFENLKYFQYMRKSEAMNKAQEYVEKHFIVVAQ